LNPGTVGVADNERTRSRVARQKSQGGDVTQGDGIDVAAKAWGFFVLPMQHEVLCWREALFPTGLIEKCIQWCSI